MIEHMVKSIECYTSEIPLGSHIESDIYTLSDTLLVPAGTSVTDKVIKKLKNYLGKVKISIKLDVAKNKDFNILINEADEQDKIFKLSNSIKSRTLESVELMYNGSSKEDIQKSAITITNTLVSSLDYSKAVSISLDSLKVSDEYTFKHCVDVGAMSMVIARKLGESNKFIKDIALAGVLHDLGKSKIPLDILNKPGKLTDEEWSIMKKHSTYSYQMIKDIDTISNEIKRAVLEHHENVDGTGYPLGLTGDKICKMAKIITIADVYDALVTERPYKKAKSPADALEIIMGMSNKFDIDILQVFIKCIILYPIGTTIKLSNGDLCVVLKNNENYPLRPVCQNIKTGQIYDLLNDQACLCLVIV